MTANYSDSNSKKPFNFHKSPHSVHHVFPWVLWPKETHIRYVVNSTEIRKRGDVMWYDLGALIAARATERWMSWSS